MRKLRGTFRRLARGCRFEENLRDAGRRGGFLNMEENVYPARRGGGLPTISILSLFPPFIKFVILFALADINYPIFFTLALVYQARNSETKIFFTFKPTLYIYLGCIYKILYFSLSEKQNFSVKRKGMFSIQIQYRTVTVRARMRMRNIRPKKDKKRNRSRKFKFGPAKV